MAGSPVRFASAFADLIENLVTAMACPRVVVAAARLVDLAMCGEVTDRVTKPCRLPLVTAVATVGDRSTETQGFIGARVSIGVGCCRPPSASSGVVLDHVLGDERVALARDHCQMARRDLRIARDVDALGLD